MKRLVCILLIVPFVAGLINLPVWAGGPPPSSLQYGSAAQNSGDSVMREEAPLRDEPAGELLITDGLILRPAGLAASVVGLAAAVLLTPWAMFSHSEDRLCRELIQKPFRYTFERPLGDVENTTGK